MGTPSSTLNGSVQLSYCRHNEEHNEERQTEDRAGRNPLRSFLLLVGHSHVVVSHLSWHGLPENVLQCGQCLARTVARCRAPIDLSALEQVVPHDELWPTARLDAGEGAQWNHLSLGVSDIKL